MTQQSFPLLLVWMAVSFGLSAAAADVLVRDISPSVSDLMNRMDEMERRHENEVNILHMRIKALESLHASDVQQMSDRDSKIDSLDNRVKHLNDLFKEHTAEQGQKPMRNSNSGIPHANIEHAFDVKNVSGHYGNLVGPNNEETYDTHQESNPTKTPRGIEPRQNRVTRVGSAASTGIGFHAILGHVVENPGLGQAIPFRNVITNIGSNYSPNSGIFRCTQAGVYVFTFTLSLAGNEWVDAQIRRNGHMISAVTCGNDYHWSSCTGTAVIELVQGDEVWVAVSFKPQSIHLESSFSLFSGFLLSYPEWH